MSLETHGEIVKTSAGLAERVQMLSAEKERFQGELLRIQAELRECTEALFQVKSSNAVFEAEKKNLEEQLRAQKLQFDELMRQSKSEFQIVANKILEDNSKNFSERSEKNLENILKPLREKITIFEKSVEDKFNNEGKEKFALKSEIEKLVTLNDRLSKEANSLTQALKGDSKVQGDWGEMILSRILEASGLRKGHDYETQSHMANEEGDRLRPDVIIRLPENKQVIVDSKVSLKAYETYCSCTDEKLRKQALKAHIDSVRSHVAQLSAKNYHQLAGVNSPEFVFLFIPIEPAYLLAMQEDPELSQRAWNAKIAIVTSTTLFTSLKTVASIWKVENRNKNAEEIAREAAGLYDKFIGFYEDFEKIGRYFDSGKAAFEGARMKLREGKGNVFRKLDNLKLLGASPKSQIRPDLLE